MSHLNSSDNDIERCNRTLELQPITTPSPWFVNRMRTLDHQAFIAAITCLSKFIVQAGSISKQFALRHSQRSVLRNYCFQDLASLRKRVVYQNLSVCEEQIICNQNDGNCDEQLTAHSLATESLLQFTKWQNAIVVRRNDLAVDNNVYSQFSERLDQLGKTVSDLVHRSRIDSHSIAFCVSLRANTIKLIFNQEFFRHCSSDITQVSR